MLNLFLPIRLGNNFIIKKNIIIIYITEYSFSADLVQANGKNRIIIQSIKHNFEEYRNIYDVEYMYSLMAKLIGNWEHDYAKIILPSNIIIFKSFTSPFNDIEKVKMIAPFELESFLPFSLSEASIDVIYQNKVKNTTANKILAVVTKEDFLNIYRESCQKAAVKMTDISVDSIEIIQYVLYYSNINHDFFLVLYKNIYQLSLYLYQKDSLLGIKNIILNKDSDTNNHDLLIKTITFLLEENKVSNLKNIYTINISAEDTVITIVKEKFSEINIFHIASDLLINNKIITYKDNSQNQNLTKENNANIIFDFLLKENNIFNLAHKELNDIKSKILLKQIIVGITLTCLLIISFFCIYFFDNYRLNNKLAKTENDGIAYLKKEFSLNNKDTHSIDTAIKESKKIIEKFENNLPIPVVRHKFLFITVFSKLINTLSDSIQGLTIDEIKWKLKNQDGSADSLSIIGAVKDFDSLHWLEESLKKSNLFTEIPPQQDLQFSFNLFIVNNAENTL